MNKKHPHTHVLRNLGEGGAPVTPERRDLGEQPIAQIMRELELIPHDLVAHSSEQLNHKMVKKACKGRRLTSNLKTKIRNAINRKTGKDYSTPDLFNY